MDLIVIGGGAAGLFAAIAAKQKNPSASVLLLEKSAVLLSKVRISGGGRCNVTHSCFNPVPLSQNYPRGSKELIGPFHRFQPSDTVQWFESRGVPLKIEEDGRIFPVSDQSSSIIDCLLNEAKQLGVEIRLRQRIDKIEKKEGLFELTLPSGPLSTRQLLLATGSSPDGHLWASSFGHTIQKPIPSLFTFNIPSSPLKELSGIAVDPVEVRIDSTDFIQKGPLLITHFGFSGPAILKLSAFAARTLNETEYRFSISVNWLPSHTEESLFSLLTSLKSTSPQKLLANENPFSLPKNLWKTLLLSEKKICDHSAKEFRALAGKLHRDIYHIEGKTTHKEEFVTCGGVSLKEVDFKTMESKLCPGLHFAGEILDIDGVTGGFNFQNAWTTGFLSGSALLKS